MKLNILLVATALLTGCNDPGMTANAPADDAVRINRPLTAHFALRTIEDVKRGNVCYVVVPMDKHASAAISCLPAMSDDEPECTPDVTAKDGTVFPGVCPAEFEGR